MFGHLGLLWETFAFPTQPVRQNGTGTQFTVFLDAKDIWATKLMLAKIYWHLLTQKTIYVSFFLGYVIPFVYAKLISRKGAVYNTTKCM